MRLIDADALLERHDAYYDRYECLVLRYAIEKAPTIDAVEIVRCKDCTWLYHGTCPKMLGKRMKPDDFCSRGERRDSDG